MKINSGMEHLIRTCNLKSQVLLEALRSILDEGLVHSDGCVLLRSQLKLTQPNLRERFEDDTGYECFVNHIHLEDIVSSVEPCALLGQALAFVNELGVLKARSNISGVFECIIVCDLDEVNLRFHTLRPGQNWLADDIEEYREAVAAIRLNGETEIWKNQ